MTKVEQYLIEQARAELSLFGLPMASYEASIEGEGSPCDVVFTHQSLTVRLSQVYFDEETGEFLQYGSNTGELVF